MCYIPSPFPLDRRDGVRRVYYSGHQMAYEAYWHAWTRDSDDKLCAVLEFPDGSIRLELMISCLTFVDQEFRKVLND